MIYLSAVGMVNALGNSADEIAANLIAGVAPGMRQRAGWLQGLPEAVLGGVEGELPPVPESFSAHRSRNNQLLLAALALIFNLLVCNVIYHRGGGFHTNLILLLILPVIPGAVDDSAD